MVGMVKQTQHNTSINFISKLIFNYLFLYIIPCMYVGIIQLYIYIYLYQNIRTKINIEIKND